MWSHLDVYRRKMDVKWTRLLIQITYFRHKLDEFVWYRHLCCQTSYWDAKIIHEKILDTIKFITAEKKVKRLWNLGPDIELITLFALNFDIQDLHQQVYFGMVEYYHFEDEFHASSTGIWFETFTKNHEIQIFIHGSHTQISVRSHRYSSPNHDPIFIVFVSK